MRSQRFVAEAVSNCACVVLCVSETSCSSLDLISTGEVVAETKIDVVINGYDGTEEHPA